MDRPNLVLTIPHGSMVATSLGIGGLAHHLSPGSGKHFQGRAIFADLRLNDGEPAFSLLPEGGWRDAQGDMVAALAAVRAGKRTKTALSNNAFSATPIAAYETVYIVKTGGQALRMEPMAELQRFEASECPDGTSPEDIGRLLGAPPPARRDPRLYAILSPIELLVLSNLTPVEYAWYATRRPGKIFRQVCFFELGAEQSHLAAGSRYAGAREELAANPRKKTKTIAVQGLLDAVPFASWVGYDRQREGGLYLADRERILLARFPAEIPFGWEKAA
ncbi:MAG TPA: hypothetical protein PKO05_08455 [Thermoanaerobaculia bacterium]|nr:MAG: hypothetical protein BWX64_00914 [Acidobacteria bacterium ADurb.Bin051]HNU83446.1 hypothetical protein [Thermoanaerobaculia bacterium]HNZ96444.1 hypothetical protein [Thermoanaerobaculia bacterium]